MTCTKLIAAVMALSFVAIGAADAAPKKKVVRPDGTVAYLAANATATARPPWAQPWECFTDEGYGRFRPCSAGRK